jgi:hypothetical protein
VKRNNILALLLFFVPLICTIVMGVVISTTPNSEIVGMYKSPVCKNDYIAFIDDDCVSCGSLITDSGIMYKRGEAYVYDLDNSSRKIKFSDYFSSLDEFNSTRSHVLNCSVVFIFCSLCFIIICINYLVYLRKNKKAKKEEGSL